MAESRYCEKCGAKNTSEAVYCVRCGNHLASVDIDNDTPVQTQPSQTTNAEEELGFALQYFSKLKDTYEEYPQVVQQYEETRDHDQSVALGIGMAFAVVFLVTTLTVFVCYDVGFGLLLSAVPAIVAGVIAYKKVKKDHLDEVYGLEQQVQRMADKLVKHYESYPGKCPVHPEFSDPRILERLFNLVHTGRADTVKEAINHMEEEMHRERMEMSQRMILSKAEQIERNSRKAANASTVSAFMSTASFMTRKRD